MTKLLKFIRKHYSVVVPITCVFLLLVFVTTYSPSELSFAYTLVPLALIWVILFSLLRYVSGVGSERVRILSKPLAVILPSTVVLGLMFLALGNVTIFDFSLLVMLTLLGNFYLIRTWPKQR